MGHLVLARKYRPKTFNEVIGQKHITTSLENALKTQKFGHAYLLTGTRGIGKTSVARIFGKAIRCEQRTSEQNSCGVCPSCQDFDSGSSLNVLEIDGASNNSVENIRDLINEVHFLPSVGKYKIYIIDEVHMLSTSAFNALLKTLEEPPEHVIFILATTDPEKLLGTVLSRCQRFDFRECSQEDLLLHLKDICIKENITYEKDYLLLDICKLGNGSVRDTLSFLDQVLSFSEHNVINEEILAISLGLAKRTAIKDLTSGILGGDTEGISKIYRQMSKENVPVKNIIMSVLDNLFEIIENFEAYQSTENNCVDCNALKMISKAELFWIYETIVKDSTWALESLIPTKVVEIIFQKISLRRSFFNQDILSEETQYVPMQSSPVIEEEEEEIEEKFETDYTPLDSLSPDFADEPKKKAQIPKTWDGFLEFLAKDSPATASNLEQGNLIGEIIQNNRELIINYGFSSSSKVFFDYISERESCENLKEILSHYFQVKKEQVQFLPKLITEGVFYSIADNKREHLKQLSREKEDRLRNNPLILEAQSIFNSTIDRVVVNEESLK